MQKRLTRLPWTSVLIPIPSRSGSRLAPQHAQPAEPSPQQQTAPQVAAQREAADATPQQQQAAETKPQQPGVDKPGDWINVNRCDKE